MEETAVTPVLVVRAVLELGALLLVLAVLLVRTDLRKVLQPLGAAVLTSFFVFLGAWGAVQMLDRWQYDYPQSVSFIPLTRFAMYQVQLESSVEASYSWQATLDDGSRREVNIAEEFETIGLPPLSTRMRVLMDDVRQPDSPERAAAVDELELFAAGLDASLRADGVRATRIEFSRVTGDPRDVSEEVLLSWDVAELGQDR